MTLKFIVHGIEVTASNAAEAAALIRELGNPPAPQPAPVRATIEGQRPRILIRKRGFNLNYAAVDFLSLISNAGDRGIAAEGLMPALHVNHAKGIGARSGMINKLLSELGFQPDQVYENPRTPEGRIWKAGSKMDAALEAVKRKANA